MRIVLVSPFKAERDALHQLLTEDGHQVSAVATRDEAMDIALATPPDFLIADAQVVGIDAPALTRALVERGLEARLILLCPRANRACATSEVLCLTKPIDLAKMRRYLGEAVREDRVA